MKKPYGLKLLNAMFCVQIVMQSKHMSDSSDICSCNKNCSCRCFDSIYDSGYENGWIDCWKFLQSFFGTAPDK